MKKSKADVQTSNKKKAASSKKPANKETNEMVSMGQILNWLIQNDGVNQNLDHAVWISAAIIGITCMPFDFFLKQLDAMKEQADASDNENDKMTITLLDSVWRTFVRNKDGLVQGNEFLPKYLDQVFSGRYDNEHKLQLLTGLIFVARLIKCPREVAAAAFNLAPLLARVVISENTEAVKELLETSPDAIPLNGQMAGLFQQIMNAIITSNPSKLH